MAYLLWFTDYQSISLHKENPIFNAKSQLTQFYKGQNVIFLKMGGGVHLPGLNKDIQV
jgi:hypothetical protein